MEEILCKGKFFMFFLLVLFDFPRYSTVFADPNSSQDLVSNENEQVNENTQLLDVLNRHQLQLEKLEGLVKNLTELVSRLESRFSEYPKTEKWDEKQEISEISLMGHGFSRETGDEGKLESKVTDEERVETVSVMKFSALWSERFQFVSAVRLGSNPTCINVLPIKDSEGSTKYVAIGDDHGKVFVFPRNGDTPVEFSALPGSPVTSMLSYLSTYKNETVMVTGHENGVILMHRIWDPSNGEEMSILRMESIRKFASPDVSEVGSSIAILEVHHVGRNRYILSADLSGKIRVFRENGTVYGLVVPKSKPLAFLKQRLLFLTETGAGSLDLRTMKVRESECEGLNNSYSKSYIFDASERSKAYGFTSKGDLIHVLLLGDIMNFKCRVRSKKKLDMVDPLSLQSIKGYLLIANKEIIRVYNVSSQHYVRAGGPKVLFSAALDEITASFQSYQLKDAKGKTETVIPLVSSDRDRLVIISLGGGYLGMYQSNLPVYKNEFNTMLWTTPVLFFILFLFGAWHFFANKKEALTSWGPDDPFSSTSTAINGGAPLGNGTGDRSFAESSRNADTVDMRDSRLRGPSGRYVSPTRYAGGLAGPYRPSSADTSSRPPSVDNNFKNTSELKFRGSNLETTGFPKRRESLFAGSQIVDDNS